MNLLTHLKQTTLLFLVTTVLSSFGLLEKVHAVVPTPDGCYPGYTTAEGCNALNFLTSGLGNTGVGWYALFSNTDANYSTGVGAGALVLNNAASNTAVGTAAMLLNTSGFGNVALGTDALLYNDSGMLNTAVGFQALFNNNSGDQNTAVGEVALSANIDGNQNTAIGQFALLQNDHGDANTANGFQALAHNTGGTFNVGIGDNVLFSNTTGAENTAVGSGAGFNQDTGSGNVYIGDGVGGVAGESNHTYIRNINTTSVSGGGTDTVTVNLMTGLLGHASSSQRYKENIKPMDKTSEAIYRLNPVTYCYKKEVDPTQSSAFGLIAEEVANVNPDLVAHNAKGQPENVHYEMINAMLLNEFLKEHRKVEEQDRRIQKQEAVIAELKSGMKALAATVNQQASELHKVTAQVKMNGSSVEVIAGNY